MGKELYQSFANRLIQTLKDKGHTASRSPNGICIRTLADFTGASEQICRRYIRGAALPDYEKIVQLAKQLGVNPGWLLFGEDSNKTAEQPTLNEMLLHYILKHSHHLYSPAMDTNDDYANFVLELAKEVSKINTSEENLIKIIDLALGSISSYKEQRKKQSHVI